MAESLAALGAAAAAAQFAQQALAITIYFYQTFSKIHDAPETVQKNLAQVEQLLSLSRLVISNPSLQTDSIATILGACLQEATKLHTILRDLTPSTHAGKPEKLIKAFAAVLKDDKVQKLLQRLDRNKTSLVIAMHEINSALLQSIGIQISAAQTGIGEVLLFVNDTSRNVQTTMSALTGVANQVTTIHSKIPELSDKLTALHDHLPTLLAMLKDNQDTLLAAISGCSSKSEGYFNVPNRRAHQFVGRQTILDTISVGLGKDSDTAKCLVLRGLGGQGKSRIALEYSLKARNSPYTTTFWIDATSENTIKRAYELFYRKFKAPDDVVDRLDSIADFVRDSFEQMSEPWLMVFDNYDSPDTVNIQDYMPLNKIGSILITTRHAEIKQLATNGLAIEVDALDSSDAAELLLASSGLQLGSRDIAKQIASCLSNHALAIVQAGACIRKCKIRLEDFVAYYHENREKFLLRKLSAAEYNRIRTDGTSALDVFATWELSFEQLRAEQRNYREDLLTLLSFFDGQDISEHPFKVFCSNVQPWNTATAMEASVGAFLASRLGDWQSDIFADLLAEFSDLTLIQSYELGEDGFFHITFHPLVRTWVRLRVGKERSHEYRMLVTEMLLELLNPSMLDRPSDYRIAQGIFAVPDSQWGGLSDTDISERETPHLSEFLEIQLSVVSLLESSGNYVASESLGRRLVRAMEKVYGANDLNTMKAKDRLCKSLYQLQRYEEAEAMLRSLQIQVRDLVGADHNLSYVVTTQWAQCLVLLGRYGEAEDLFIYQLEHDGLRLPDDHPQVLSQFINLSRLYLDQRKLESCAVMIRRVAERTSGMMDSHQRWFLDFLYIWGAYLIETGETASARDLIYRAWVGLQTILGNSHPDTLKALFDFAHLEGRLGNWASVDRSVTASLLRQAKMEGHEITPKLDNLLGVSLLKKECLAEAEAHFTRMLEESATTGNHQYDAVVTQNLAVVLCKLGKLDHAEEIITKSLERNLHVPKTTSSAKEILRKIGEHKAGTIVLDLQSANSLTFLY